VFVTHGEEPTEAGNRTGVGHMRPALHANELRELYWQMRADPADVLRISRASISQGTLPKRSSRGESRRDGRRRRPACSQGA